MKLKELEDRITHLRHLDLVDDESEVIICTANNSEQVILGKNFITAGGPENQLRVHSRTPKIAEHS